MKIALPAVGTNRLLDCLSDYVPDAFISHVCARDFTGGRRYALSAAQLWRVHLLALLTSTHSLNLLVAQLPEQAMWRRFARLRRVHPTARMLHEFRQQMGVDGLRDINRYLVGRLLRRRGLQPQAVALMDATDLQAACGGFKKKFRMLHSQACRRRLAHDQGGPKPLVYRLQETHTATVVADPASLRDVGAAGQLGHSCQCGGRRLACAQSAMVSAMLGLVAGDCGGRHELFVRQEQTTGSGRLADSSSDQNPI